MPDDKRNKQILTDIKTNLQDGGQPAGVTLYTFDEVFAGLHPDDALAVLHVQSAAGRRTVELRGSRRPPARRRPSWRRFCAAQDAPSRPRPRPDPR